MKVQGLVLIFGVALLLIPMHSEAQTTGSSNTTSSGQYHQLLEKLYFKTGNIYYDRGNYTGAISYYDKALQINSTDINSLYNKALALYDLGKVDEAITYYDKVLAIDPNDTDTLNNKGLALDNIGKHEEAITYYDKILLIDPLDTDALYNKALALDSLGKHSQAVSYYKNVLEINPSDVDALNKLNLTYNSPDKGKALASSFPDQTAPIAVGVIVVLAICIAVINLVARKGRKILKQEVSEITVPMKEEEKSVAVTEIQEEKPKPEEITDNEWKGV